MNLEQSYLKWFVPLLLIWRLELWLHTLGLCSVKVWESVHLSNEQACGCPFADSELRARAEWTHTQWVGFQHPKERTSPRSSLGQQCNAVDIIILQMLFSRKASFQGTRNYARLPPLPRSSWGLAPAGVCQAGPVPQSGLCSQEEGVFFWLTQRVLNERAESSILPPSLQILSKEQWEGFK